MNGKPIFLVFFITFFLYFSSATKWSINLPYYQLLGGIDASVDQPFRDFVTEYGYPYEVHTDVQTKDGYLLTLFRIPYGIKTNNSNVKNKIPVLLIHGLLLGAEDWVVLGPKKGLGFILADAGYDVWMGNVRGTMHSRKHVKLNPNWNGKFWDFSFHEFGYYDLPAMVDHILKTTKQKQLYYIGHSQGGGDFFVLNSLRPEYNKRFKLMIALAPAILTSHTKNIPIRALAATNSINGLILKLGFTEVPHFRFYSYLGKTVCKVKGIPQWICQKLHFFGFGGISKYFSQELMPKLMRYQYSGVSFKLLIHDEQLIVNKCFCKYDYGKGKNKKLYGSEKPPSYNLTKVVAPVAYFYGKHDTVIVPEDQLNAMKLIPNIVDKYEVPYKKFTHMDMVVGNDAESMVYQRVLKLMKKYGKK